MQSIRAWRLRQQEDEDACLNLWTRNQSQTRSRAGLQGLWPGDLFLPVRPHKEHQPGTKWEALHTQTTVDVVYNFIQKGVDPDHHEKQVFDITNEAPLPSLGVKQGSLLFQHLILSLSGREVPRWTICILFSQCSSVLLRSPLLGSRDSLVLKSIWLLLQRPEFSSQLPHLVAHNWL